MPVRNDASAVAKAARAVSRQVAAELVRMRLVARLPRQRAIPAQLPSLGDRRFNDELMQREVWDGAAWIWVGSQQSGLGEDGELKVPSSSGGAGSSAGGRSRRRSSPRRSAHLDYRKVRKALGSLPRYGTKRYDKAWTVRDALSNAADGYLYVWQLVGRHYDSGKDTITLHDLDVMVEKQLITINDQ